MRVLGLILFLLGGGATALTTLASFRRSRPQDLLFAALAPLALVLALAGLVLLFVPGFFG